MFICTLLILMLFVVLKAYGNLEALLLAIYDSVSKSLQKIYSVNNNKIISPLKIPQPKKCSSVC